MQSLASLAAVAPAPGVPGELAAPKEGGSLCPAPLVGQERGVLAAGAEQSGAVDGETHLDAEQKLLVRHLQPPGVVLQVPRPLQVLLHPLDVVHGSLQDCPFVPAHVPAVQDEKNKKKKKDCCLHLLPPKRPSARISCHGAAHGAEQAHESRGYPSPAAAGDTYRSLALGISIPSSLMRSLMLNLRRLSTAGREERGAVRRRGGSSAAPPPQLAGMGDAVPLGVPSELGSSG